MGGWRIAPWILNLSTRWKWVVTLTFRPLDLSGKVLGSNLRWDTSWPHWGFLRFSSNSGIAPWLGHDRPSISSLVYPVFEFFIGAWIPEVTGHVAEWQWRTLVHPLAKLYHSMLYNLTSWNEPQTKKALPQGNKTSGTQWTWSVGRGNGLDAVEKKKSVLQQKNERGFPTRESVIILIELSVLQNEASLNVSEGTVLSLFWRRYRMFGTPRAVSSCGQMRRHSRAPWC
jgi:hypothetical protein